MGKDLIRKYGKKRAYSTSEIKTAWRERGYTPDYMCYAMAAYTSATDFQDYHDRTAEDCNYFLMREEISEACLNGQRDFTILDIADGGSSGWLSDMSSGSDSTDSGGGAGSDGGGD